MILQEAALRYVGAQTNGYDLLMTIIIMGSLLIVAGSTLYFMFYVPQKRRREGPS